ncbi:N-succinylarginine dihydrolase [Frankliniella fusca]|uniref:N-succinylarginine dihydrolase n=1 Tax=Frankliniella fusca TaxID=407009 RepID=A0AAE1HJH3_9NEOP|nr:N-succinylarginine dihydrolase [Frankliniella fusca]
MTVYVEVYVRCRRTCHSWTSLLVYGGQTTASPYHREDRFSTLQSKNTAPPYPVLHTVSSTVVPYIAIYHRVCVTLKVRHCRLF